MNLLWTFLISYVLCDSWKNKFKERDCYKCSRYEYSKANFSSLTAVSEDEIVIGAKNSVFKILFQPLKAISFYDEVPVKSNSAYQNCIDGGRSREDCQNYYKVLVQLTESDLMLCGTRSFQPMCDIRRLSDLSYKSRDHVLSGDTICPSDPDIRTSVVVLSSDANVGFSATCIDECTDNQISRINLLPGSLSFNGRTMGTTDWLNRPTFVYSFEEGEYVYFLFYETAIEVRTEQVYSRVARICKNDVGSGQEYFSNYFLSYSKARIYCTSNRPGETPFNHNEIGGAFYKAGTLYAVFSGQRNLKTGSILCSFSIKDINAVFEGPYITYQDDIKEWVTTPNMPFSCSNKKSINVAAYQTMMERPIYQNEPLYYTQTETRLTSVAVITTRVRDRSFTIIFSGSEEGYVVRLGLEQGLAGNPHSSILKVADVGSVDSLTLSPDTSHIFALSESWVARIPTRLGGEACHYARTCSECLDLFYPHCSWCKTNNEMRCVARMTDCIPTDLVGPTATCLPLPTFREIPGDKVAPRGSLVQLLCSGRDGEVGVWRREDGQPITRRAILTTSSLTIPVAELVDSGGYICTLNNTSGRVSVSGSITVTELPYLIQEPIDVTSFEEDINVELVCEAGGTPPPVLEWFKAGESVPDGSEVTNSGSLRIYRVLRGDAGSYWCTATNSVGTIRSRVATLTVLDGVMENTEEEKDSGGLPNVTMVGMIVAIVVSAIICFAIGLGVHKLYRNHRMKRQSEGSQTPGCRGRGGPWTPVNTLPYQMCRPEEWRDSGVFTTPHTLLPPPLPSRSELLSGVDLAGTLVEEEAPPAYDDAPGGVLACSAALSPLSPTARYTPSHFSDLYSSHYTPLNADYAVITAPIPPRQYSMDLRAGTHNTTDIVSAAPAGAAADRITPADMARPPPSGIVRAGPFSPPTMSIHQHNV